MSGGSISLEKRIPGEYYARRDSGVDLKIAGQKGPGGDG